jgi:hypothetical protein
VPLIEPSTLDLDDMQLPMNLNLNQHPVISSSPSFFFLSFDFSTFQAPTGIASGPNPISQIPKLSLISQKHPISPITTIPVYFNTTNPPKPKNIKMQHININNKKKSPKQK